jgi:DHA1 family bicyclomycin/chloramphenicol resistance-like MFS transporter
LYAGADAERMLSLVTMIFSISPAIAPVIGGWIVTLSNWRTIFLFLFVFTVCLLWLCYRLLPETLPIPRRQPFNPQSLWRNYRQIFGSSLFQLKAGAIAFNFSGLFIYVAAAPVLMTHHLGLGPQDFGWMFIPSVAGIFLGALAANRMAGRIQVRVQVLMGFALLMLSGVFNVGYHLFFPPVLFWTIAPLFFYTMGMSMVAPGLTLLVLDLFPHIRGTVASCQSFTMTMLSALVAGVIVPLLSDSVLWLAAGQFSFALIGLLLWLLGHRVGKIQRSIQ